MFQFKYPIMRFFSNTNILEFSDMAKVMLHMYLKGYGFLIG